MERYFHFISQQFSSNEKIKFCDLYYLFCKYEILCEYGFNIFCKELQQQFKYETIQFSNISSSISLFCNITWKSESQNERVFFKRMKYLRKISKIIFSCQNQHAEHIIHDIVKVLSVKDKINLIISYFAGIKDSKKSTILFSNQLNKVIDNLHNDYLKFINKTKTKKLKKISEIKEDNSKIKLFSWSTLAYFHQEIEKLGKSLQITQQLKSISQIENMIKILLNEYANNSASLIQERKLEKAFLLDKMVMQDKKNQSCIDSVKQILKNQYKNIHEILSRDSQELCKIIKNDMTSFSRISAITVEDYIKAPFRGIKHTISKEFQFHLSTSTQSEFPFIIIRELFYFSAKIISECLQLQTNPTLLSSNSNSSILWQNANNKDFNEFVFIFCKYLFELIDQLFTIPSMNTHSYSSLSHFHTFLRYVMTVQQQLTNSEGSIHNSQVVNKKYKLFQLSLSILWNEYPFDCYLFHKVEDKFRSTNSMFPSDISLECLSFSSNNPSSLAVPLSLPDTSHTFHWNKFVPFYLSHKYSDFLPDYPHFIVIHSIFDIFHSLFHFRNTHSPTTSIDAKPLFQETLIEGFSTNPPMVDVLSSNGPLFLHSHSILHFIYQFLSFHSDKFNEYMDYFVHYSLDSILYTSYSPPIPSGKTVNTPNPVDDRTSHPSNNAMNIHGVLFNEKTYRQHIIIEILYYLLYVEYKIKVNQKNEYQIKQKMEENTETKGDRDKEGTNKHHVYINNNNNNNNDINNYKSYLLDKYINYLQNTPMNKDIDADIIHLLKIRLVENKYNQEQQVNQLEELLSVEQFQQIKEYLKMNKNRQHGYSNDMETHDSDRNEREYGSVEDNKTLVEENHIIDCDGDDAGNPLVEEWIVSKLLQLYRTDKNKCKITIKGYYTNKETWKNNQETKKCSQSEKIFNKQWKLERLKDELKNRPWKRSKATQKVINEKELNKLLQSILIWHVKDKQLIEIIYFNYLPSLPDIIRNHFYLSHSKEFHQLYKRMKSKPLHTIPLTHKILLHIMGNSNSPLSSSYHHPSFNEDELNQSVTSTVSSLNSNNIFLSESPLTSSSHKHIIEPNESSKQFRSLLVLYLNGAIPQTKCTSSHDEAQLNESVMEGNENKNMLMVELMITTMLLHLSSETHYESNRMEIHLYLTLIAEYMDHFLHDVFLFYIKEVFKYLHQWSKVQIMILLRLLSLINPFINWNDLFTHSLLCNLYFNSPILGFIHQHSGYNAVPRTTNVNEGAALYHSRPPGCYYDIIHFIIHEFPISCLYDATTKEFTKLHHRIIYLYSHPLLHEHYLSNYPHVMEFIIQQIHIPLNLHFFQSSPITNRYKHNVSLPNNSNYLHSILLPTTQYAELKMSHEEKDSSLTTSFLLLHPHHYMDWEYRLFANINSKVISSKMSNLSNNNTINAANKLPSDTFEKINSHSIKHYFSRNFECIMHVMEILQQRMKKKFNERTLARIQKEYQHIMRTMKNIVLIFETYLLEQSISLGKGKENESKVKNYNEIIVEMVNNNISTWTSTSFHWIGNQFWFIGYIYSTLLSLPTPSLQPFAQYAPTHLINSIHPFNFFPIDIHLSLENQSPSELELPIERYLNHFDKWISFFSKMSQEMENEYRKMPRNRQIPQSDYVNSIFMKFLISLHNPTFWLCIFSSVTHNTTKEESSFSLLNHTLLKIVEYINTNLYHASKYLLLTLWTHCKSIIVNNIHLFSFPSSSSKSAFSTMESVVDPLLFGDSNHSHPPQLLHGFVLPLCNTLFEHFNSNYENLLKNQDVILGNPQLSQAKATKHSQKLIPPFLQEEHKNPYHSLNRGYNQSTLNELRRYNEFLPANVGENFHDLIFYSIQLSSAAKSSPSSSIPQGKSSIPKPKFLSTFPSVPTTTESEPEEPIVLVKVVEPTKNPNNSDLVNNTIVPPANKSNEKLFPRKANTISTSKKVVRNLEPNSTTPSNLLVYNTSHLPPIAPAPLINERILTTPYPHGGSMLKPFLLPFPQYKMANASTHYTYYVPNNFPIPTVAHAPLSQSNVTVTRKKPKKPKKTKKPKDEVKPATKRSASDVFSTTISIKRKKTS